MSHTHSNSQLQETKSKDILLPPATKLRQGNVFTPVCDSVHGGALYQGDPPGQRPPDRDPLDRDPPPGHRPFPWTENPPGQTPPLTEIPSPWTETPLRLDRDPVPLDRDLLPLDGGPPLGRDPPPSSYGNERAVRILLECILIINGFINCASFVIHIDDEYFKKRIQHENTLLFNASTTHKT